MFLPRFLARLLTVEYCIITSFGIDSSSRFPFRARTQAEKHTQMQLVTSHLPLVWIIIVLFYKIITIHEYPCVCSVTNSQHNIVWWFLHSHDSQNTWYQFIQSGFHSFLPRDALLSVVYAVVVCLSMCVCVSVTLRYCIKTAKRRITQITPHDSPLTLVFWHQSSLRNSRGITPYGGDKCRWGGLKFFTFGEKRAITRKRYKIDI